MNSLPPEDQPSGEGLVPATSAEAEADAGDLEDPHNPVAIAHAFWVSVIAGEKPDREFLLELVTPETRAAWDFDEVRRHMGNRGLVSRVEGSDLPGVRYAMLLDNIPARNGVAAYRADGDLLAAGTIITLQWRPEFDSWRVHACEPRYVPPSELPSP
ncbi:hypothetical protein [Streptomyces chryseus]